MADKPEIPIMITPSELFACLTIVNECDNYGVPWYEPMLTTISTSDIKRILGAVEYLVSEIQQGADYINKKPKRKGPLKSKKKKLPPPNPETGDK